MGQEQSVEIVDLTKKLATQLWNTNPVFQRPINPEHVEKLKKEMETGNWQLTNDAIIAEVDTEGNIVKLLNGQHRVKARIEAQGTRNRVQIMLLKTPTSDKGEVRTEKGEVIPDLFMVADTGRPRTWTQFVRMVGIPNAPVVGGAILSCEQMERTGGFYSNAHSARGTNKMRYEWWEKCDKETMKTAGSLSDPVYRKMKISRPMFAAFYYQASTQVDPDLAAEFVDKMIGKVATNGSKDAPQAMRERAVRWALSHERTPYVIQWNTLLRAWHYFLTNEPVERLWWTPRNLSLKVRPDWWENGEISDDVIKAMTHEHETIVG